MPNRLADASSPYLLQHADNPVAWHEWGQEAFAEARDRGVPVLLSVGYSACHWCHVMAHESFEDDETAAFMNEHFVSVKVDREERPDVDRIYMDAVQAMTGRGGWPMTVFLTPDGEPFYAGTYYPKEDRANFPSFGRVMGAIVDAWANRRDELTTQAERLTEAIGRRIPTTGDVPGAEAVAGAIEAIEKAFDPVHGGFGGAPKFPQAPTLELLLRAAALRDDASAAAILGATLEAMRRGGIYDHIGGGFARYSVDARWLVPHFEKMLYDNALLARVYLRGWQVLGEEAFRFVATETLDYMLRDLGLPDGGLASAEDADSEGEEGKFYVFTWDEFTGAAGDHADALAEVFGASPQGNFEGKNILHLAASLPDVAARRGIDPDELTGAASTLLDRLDEVRSTRVRPGLDDKVVTAWNGLAVRALAEAGAVLGEERYLDAARRNARFVLGELRRPDGRLLRSWRDGVTSVPGFADDYAAYAIGLFSLFAATGEPEWYRAARELTVDLIEHFADADGGFFATGDDAEPLITRPKNIMDNPTPSENALAAEALLLLAAYEGPTVDGHDLHALADGVFRTTGVLADQYPSAAGHTLAALLTRTHGLLEVAVVGDPANETTRDLRKTVWERFHPHVAAAPDSGRGENAFIPLLDGRTPHDGPPTAYVCRDFLCDAPTSDPQRLAEALRGAGPA